MKTVLLATTLLASPALAANIATFSQTANTNTLAATVNGTDTVTTLTVSNAAVSIGQFAGGIPPASEFSLSAHSIDAAATLGSAVIQHYSGTFCITTATGCGGINVLSGVFSDAAFGALGGPGLVVNVNDPPDTLTLTSALVPAAELLAPNAFSLGFTNVKPLLSLVGTSPNQTIGPMTASFAGTVSSSRAVPEPGSLVVFGVGLAAILGLRARGRNKARPAA